MHVPTREVEKMIPSKTFGIQTLTLSLPRLNNRISVFLCEGCKQDMNIFLLVKQYKSHHYLYSYRLGEAYLHRNLAMFAMQLRFRPCELTHRYSMYP